MSPRGSTAEKPTEAPAEPATEAQTEDAAIECDHIEPPVRYMDDEGGGRWACSRCGEPFAPVRDRMPVEYVGGLVGAARDVVSLNGRNSRMGGALRTQLNDAVLRLESALGPFSTPADPDQ